MTYTSTLVLLVLRLPWGTGSTCIQTWPLGDELDGNMNDLRNSLTLGNCHGSQQI